MSARLRRYGAGLVVLVSGLLVVPEAAAATTDTVELRFDDGVVGDEVTSVTSTGVAPVTTQVVKDTAREGKVLFGASDAVSGIAADFPAFSTSGPRAIVAVRPVAGQPDPMNPGTARLEFGADVVLDAGTTAVAGSRDDGNNIVQRGLYLDRAQFKLELDAGRPRCRVKGSAGAVEFGSSVTVAPGTRWRLRCVRPAGSNTVTLTVAPVAGDGTVGSARSTSRSGTIGSLSYSSSVPLTVGGKLTSSLALATPSSDQFNGTVDNVMLRVG